MHLVARRLDQHLPAIPFIERLERKRERKLETKRAVIRNFTLLASPQPAIGVVKVGDILSQSMTLPSPHYLEHVSPMYFPE